MKKYLLSLLAVAVAFGCTKFEHEDPIAVVNPSSPSITVGEVGETGFSATISAQAGTGFYSYAVLKGKATDLNPTNLLKVNYKSGPAAGTVDYAKSPSKTVTVEELDRNTVYTVYAVAASVQGTVGEVVYKEVTTGDNEKPGPKAIDYADYVLTATFNEPVTYKGKRATANYYAVNTPKGAAFNIAENIPVGTVNVTIEADGNTVTFALDTIPNGAYFAINYPEGTFEDAVGNPTPAMESKFFLDKDGKLDGEGFVGRQDPVNFDLELAGDIDSIAIVKNLMEPIMMAAPEGFIFFKSENPEDGGYSIKYDGGNEQHIYTQPGPYDFGWSAEDNLAYCFPNALSGRPDPKGGDVVTISLPEGFLTDIYGNVNNTFVIGPFLYSFGYTLEDVIGYYNVEAYSYFQKKTVTFPMVIEESDNEEEGNVMITTMFGAKLDEDLHLYADFDGDSGTLTIPDRQPLWALSEEEFIRFAVNGEDYIVLSMPESGVLKDTGVWFGYYYDEEAEPGWGDIFTSFTATLGEAPDPGEDPGENPGEDPGEDPGENPGEDPGENPGEDPGEAPGEDPGEDPGDAGTTAVRRHISPKHIGTRRVI